MASPMLQEIFGGSLIGKPELGFAALDASQKAAIAVIAAGFAGLLSLFNIAGRIVWASVSDHLGRKATYFVFFALGIALYASTPTFAHMGDKALFVLRLRRDPVDVWRRLRHRPGLSRGYFRHAICRRDPWPAADRLVHCGHRRPGRGELHPRIQQGGGRAGRPPL